LGGHTLLLSKKSLSDEKEKTGQGVPWPVEVVDTAKRLLTPGWCLANDAAVK
jgi:hypothetical protein